MFKKLIIGGLLVAGASTMVMGKSSWSYLKTCGREIRQSVKSHVPIEFEIRHAQQLVEDLVPEIRRSMHVIAEQQVEVAALEKAVERRQAGLNDQKQAILALRENLDQGETRYVIAGKSYTEQQVEKDLENRFRRFRMAEETCQHEEQILEARRAALLSNEEQLATLISTKKELEAELAQLDARMRAVQAAESIHDVHRLDDSRLQRARNQIAELNKHLDVRERLLETDVQGTGAIPIERDLQPQRQISEQIDEYFQSDLATKPL